MPKLGTAVRETRDAIHERIIDSRYPAGMRLVERRLAEDLNVSRVPVREALQHLVAEGFATERPTGGIVVRQYSDTEIAELVAVHAALERVLVVELARSASQAQLETLRDQLARTESTLETGDTARAIDENAAFHLTLHALMAPSITTDVLAGIESRLRWLLRQHDDPRPIHAEHVALLQAIANHDPQRCAEIIDDHAATSLAAARALHSRDEGKS